LLFGSDIYRQQVTTFSMLEGVGMYVECGKMMKKKILYFGRWHWDPLTLTDVTTQLNKTGPGSSVKVKNIRE
jgi:hypothetical protein